MSTDANARAVIAALQKLSDLNNPWARGVLDAMQLFVDSTCEYIDTQADQIQALQTELDYRQKPMRKKLRRMAHTRST